jgi:osmotically-inducible protein OsmY
MRKTNSHQARRVPAFVVVAGCGVAAALVACDHGSTSAPPPAASASTTASASAVKTPPAIADSDIASAIKRHIQDEPMLRAEHVQVGVTQGIASLTGQVGSLLAKERALSVAESIRGIRSVVDQVTVVPVARRDDQLQSDVTRELQQDPATKPHKIGVAVKDGKVTLSGTADSFQQKKLFADVASTVVGVKAIDNGIVIHYATTRPESEIVTDVKHRLANDVWLDSASLSATVAGHTVKLVGIVGSLAQKTRAHYDAWVVGVDAVDDAGINVDWFAYDDQRHTSDYRVRSDAEITDAVRDAFRIDPRLSPLMPQVSVQGGVANLTGTVGSAKARRAAEIDAKNTLGVWYVRDEVLVQPTGKATDADIERAVKRALSEDIYLPNGKSIDVSSAKGKVLLKGTVASGFERVGAIEDALSVPGVVEVDIGLVVKHTPEELRVQIEDRMYWDPRVARDRVTVVVGADGVATLTGTLDAWSEIKAAGEDTMEGGADRVINLVKLTKHPEVAAP